MKNDEKDFFYQATLKVCGSLDIDKAMGYLFKYLKSKMPISELELKLYEKGLGAFRMIVSITNNRVEKSDEIIP